MEMAVAEARVCAGTVTGDQDMGRCTGDGYRLQFNEDLEDVHEFTSSFASTSVGSVGSGSVGSGPLHSIHGDETETDDAGIAYQLMDNDEDSGP